MLRVGCFIDGLNLISGYMHSGSLRAVKGSGNYVSPTDVCANKKTTTTNLSDKGRGHASIYIYGIAGALVQYAY